MHAPLVVLGGGPGGYAAAFMAAGAWLLRIGRRDPAAEA